MVRTKCDSVSVSSQKKIADEWATFNVHNSDFSIVSLSVFDSIVRARATVPVYVPLTLVCRVCVCARARMTVCDDFRSFCILFPFLLGTFVLTLYDL